MPQVTIVPKYINPPKGNARSASIKDENGSYWGIHPGDMSKFQQNVPVTVEYSTSENNGKVYYNIKSIVGANPQAQAQAAYRQSAQRINDANPRPNPQTQDETRKSENIFVTTVVQAAIQYQSYPLDLKSLTDLVAMAQLAWRGFGAQMTSEPPFPGSPDNYGDVNPRG